MEREESKRMNQQGEDQNHHHHYPQDQYHQYPPPAPTAPTPSYPHLQQHYYRSGPVSDPCLLSSYQNHYRDAYLDSTNSSATENGGLFTNGVYAYDGGRGNADGGRGNLPSSSSTSNCLSGYEDHQKLTGFEGGQRGNGEGKIVRAIPKDDEKQDSSDGVQKFRVKLITENSRRDVLFLIGLDCICIVDLGARKFFGVFPLETVQKCRVLASSIFAFSAKKPDYKSSVYIMIEASKYLIDLIHNTVIAAIIQLKEMGVKDGTVKSEDLDSSKTSQQQSEKKNSRLNLMNWIKHIDEDKHHWVPDNEVFNCTSCNTTFGTFLRKHHCRNCGDIFCDKCTNGRISLTSDEGAPRVRVCDDCMAEVIQRSSTTRKSVQSHEEIAKKLQAEMEKNRSASKVQEGSGVSGKTLGEVVCPTCTVRLQVEVPTNGSETIECGVCQHLFILSA